MMFKDEHNSMKCVQFTVLLFHEHKTLFALLYPAICYFISQQHSVIREVAAIQDSKVYSLFCTLYCLFVCTQFLKYQQ